MITSDFIVLPCDLVSELDGSKVLQQWMTLNPLSVSAQGVKRKGGLGVFYPTYGLEGISNKKDETDFIATVPSDPAPVPAPHGSIRPDIETLVLSMPTDTLNDKVDEESGVFKLRAQLTRKYGRVKLRTKHRDAHVYIFPEWVKNLVARNEKFESISEDVMGWWAKAQWQNGLGEKLGLGEVLGQPVASDEDRMRSANEEDESVDASQLSSTKVSLPVRPPDPTAATFASRVSNAPSTCSPARLEVPPLLAYVQPNPTSPTPSLSHPLIRRIDTAQALLATSLYLAKQPSTNALSHTDKIHPTAKLGQQSRVAQEDSLIAENVTLGFRSIVKESVVGANCEIGSGVRLTKCLLMDGVVVGDGVVLTGCVIGRRAKIEGLKPRQEGTEVEAQTGAGQKKKAAENEDEKTKLTDCEVAPNFVVERGTEAKGEKMMTFDTEEDEEGLDDEDGEDVEDSEA